MDEKKYFASFLNMFPEATFPLLIAYDIYDPQTLDAEPIPVLLTDMFVADEDASTDDSVTEYMPFAQYRLNKNYIVCILCKITLGAYEFILNVYDNDGNIQESDTIAGTYYQTDPFVYKVAQINGPNIGYIVEGPLDVNNPLNVSPDMIKSTLLLSYIGEINYSLLEN